MWDSPGTSLWAPRKEGSVLAGVEPVPACPQSPAFQPDPVKMGPVAMATPPSNGYCAKPVVPYQGWVPRRLLKPRPWATRWDLKELGGRGSNQDRHLGRSHSRWDGPQGWHGACRAQQLGCTPGIRKGASGGGCGHVGKVMGTLRPAACRVGEGTRDLKAVVGSWGSLGKE